jgi:hypothetical protein
MNVGLAIRDRAAGKGWLTFENSLQSRTAGSIEKRIWTRVEAHVWAQLWTRIWEHVGEHVVARGAPGPRGWS